MVAFVASVDQGQAVQNVQSDIFAVCFKIS